jgi:hypothetical protein
MFGGFSMKAIQLLGYPITAQMVKGQDSLHCWLKKVLNLTVLAPSLASF